ncbi:MAG: type II toxin-antitoxin system PrlF family antitoxin [Deltaproteobacteria bacterium]|nr:type II toxin-antitoxin system PrlF family antitoxin [Deltaproteobacteria bacterium]MBW1793012.1 type II toxin-antitoxin system PrlF family antitoxin [Deltaproteobacteria bacterium]
MITGTISSKVQITIPKKIRELLKVETSDKIVFIPLEGGKVMITGKQNPAALLFGMLKHRSPARPVSLEKMDSAIRKRRTKRSRQ